MHLLVLVRIALEVIKFCPDDVEPPSKALRTVTEAGINAIYDSTQQIKVTDDEYQRKMVDRAFNGSCR